MGPPFCWPCRHYRKDGPLRGSDSGISNPLDGSACAAFPEGIPSLILVGGFDHREPHPDDNGVQFEVRTDDEFDWDEDQTKTFLDRKLRRFNQRQRRMKALGATDEVMTDIPPDTGAFDRFTAPMATVTGEEALRHAAAWEEYRLTGDPEIMYEAGIWARPE